MPPSANLCCCRNARKKPLTEGIRRSTEVGTMVLNMSGKYDPNNITIPTVTTATTATTAESAAPAKPAESAESAESAEPSTANGNLSNGGLHMDKRAKIETHIHIEQVVHDRLVERAPPLELKAIELEHKDHRDFDTARTSREEAVKDHLTMKDLVRQVRIEEGLEVSPRPSVSEFPPKRSTLEETAILNAYSTYTTIEPTEPITEERTTLHLNGSLRVKPKKAVFNENGDISSRTANTVVVDIERVDEYNALPTVSAIVARREPIILPPMAETKGRTIARTVAAIPQTVFTVVTATYAYCVSIIAFLASFFWQ